MCDQNFSHRFTIAAMAAFDHIFSTLALLFFLEEPTMASQAESRLADLQKLSVELLTVNPSPIDCAISDRMPLLCACVLSKSRISNNVWQWRCIATIGYDTYTVASLMAPLNSINFTLRSTKQIRRFSVHSTLERDSRTQSVPSCSD